MIANEEDARAFENLTAQWSAFQTDIESLSAKKPDGAMNLFKLRLANQLIVEANRLLEEGRLPIDDFRSFEDTEVPSYSDVVVVLSQYRRALQSLFDRFSHYHEFDGDHVRVWYVNGKVSKFPANCNL